MILLVNHAARMLAGAWRLSAGLVLALVLPLAAVGAPHPNILFILTEDQGAQLGFVGTAGIETPHMDSLAKSGAYFNNAFVAYPVCSASKASIYTGLHSHANGLLNNTINYHLPAAELTPQQELQKTYAQNRVRPSLPTLIERLRDAGFYTAAHQDLGNQGVAISDRPAHEGSMK